MKLYLKVAISFLFILISACGLVSKKEAVPAEPKLRSELLQAEKELKSGITKKAIPRLQKIVTQHPEIDVADDANILLGQHYYAQGDYDKSARYFSAVLDSEYFSPREIDACFGGAQSLQKLGRFDEALSLSQRALKSKTLSQKMQFDIYSLQHQLQLSLGDRVEALKSLIRLTSLSTDAERVERYKIKAQEVVESNLKESELASIAQDPAFGFVRLQALYRVGIISFEQKDFTRAESYFEQLQTLAPQSDLSLEAKNYLEQISARRRVAPFTIGAVLPMSGKYSSVAMKTLRGLEMGLGIRDATPTNFRLAVMDSAGNSDQARRAVERLVVEDSAIAIVGDLLSKTADPVAQKASELGVPLIGLSQKSGLTSISEYVFRNALTSAAIVGSLVDHAMTQQGFKKFAILYPNDAYGVEYANLFWDAVLSRGGEIRAAQTYSSKETDFNSVINRLVGTYYVEARASEYTYLVKDWYSKQKVITSRVVPPSDLLTPLVDFDALFIPDGTKALSQISSMLVFNDVSAMRLMGTNLWNTPGLISRGSNLIEKALFVDSKSVVDESLKRSSFAVNFQKIYGEWPSSFEAQAYDVGLALRNIVTSGARSRIDLKDRLSRLNNLSGAEGLISVNSDREFSKSLAILTVADGKIIEVSNPIQTIER